MAFEISFRPEAVTDLKALKKNERSRLIDNIERQLLHEPGSETRNRKRLRPNEIANWELRIGRFRVLYNIDDKAQMVSIEAVGFKIGDLLFIRGIRREL